jgi:serine/threonine-protein kinase
MDPVLARHYIQPLFAAVDYAHNQGVVHRDLKPENIMITITDVVKVADFGLGRALDSESLTRTDTALGTPAYMAPEQVKGVHFEPASDQYALGVVAYEVLCGKRPFEAAEPVQMIFKHVSEPPRPPRDLRPDIPADVEAVLLKMLAKEPHERYATVAEAGKHLVEALDRW